MENLKNEIDQFEKVSRELRKIMKNHLNGKSAADVRTNGAFLITELKNINERAQRAKDQLVNQV